MKDRSRDLRRSGRGPGQYARRIRTGYLQHLRDVWSQTDGEVRQPSHRKGEEGTVRKPRTREQRTNWRVNTLPNGEIVAVEPNREFEHVFEDDFADPLMAALEYAAKQLRGGGEEEKAS